METSAKQNSRVPVGHVDMPALTIGAMALALGVGLAVIGLVDRLNAFIAAKLPIPGPPQHLLPAILPLFAAAILSFGLAYAMLCTPGLSRRVLLCLSTVILTFTWAPVLAIADYRPDVALPLVSALWAGICAIVYTANHRMPSDTPASHGPS